MPEAKLAREIIVKHTTLIFFSNYLRVRAHKVGFWSAEV